MDKRENCAPAACATSFVHANLKPYQSWLLPLPLPIAIAITLAIPLPVPVSKRIMLVTQVGAETFHLWRSAVAATSAERGERVTNRASPVVEHRVSSSGRSQNVLRVRGVRRRSALAAYVSQSRALRSRGRRLALALAVTH